MHSSSPSRGRRRNITVLIRPSTEKLERCGPDGEKSLTTCLTVSTQYRRVTDRLADRHTDGRTDILRQHGPYYAHRAVKNQCYWVISRKIHLRNTP